MSIRILGILDPADFGEDEIPLLIPMQELEFLYEYAGISSDGFRSLRYDGVFPARS